MPKYEAMEKAMKKANLIFALALSMACGCSTTRVVELGHEDQWMSEAQADLLNRDAKANMTDGREVEGTIIRLNADSLCVRRDLDGKLHTESLGHVTSIRQSPHVWPALGGFFGGALVGAAIGGAVGMESSHPEPEVLGLNTVAGGISGAAIGALIGAAAGGIGLGLATSVTDYTFVPAPVRRSRAVPPTAVPDSLRMP